MSAPTREVQEETKSARGRVAPVPYSVLTPGRGVEWREIGDGIVIRIRSRRGLKKSEWFDIACWAVFIAMQVWLDRSMTFIVSLVVLVLGIIVWKVYLDFFAPARFRSDFNPEQ